MPAGLVTLVSAWADTPRLRFQVPCDYEVVSQEAVDFELHHLTCTAHDGGNVAGGIGVYLGHFPSLFSERVKTSVIKLPGHVGSRRVTWFKWSDKNDRGDIVNREAIVKGLFAPAPGRPSNDLKNLVVHIWVWAYTDAEADALQGSVSGLEVVE
jgi:hypothetical protein